MAEARPVRGVMEQPFGDPAHRPVAHRAYRALQDELLMHFATNTTPPSLESPGGDLPPPLAVLLAARVRARPLFAAEALLRAARLCPDAAAFQAAEFLTARTYAVYYKSLARGDWAEDSTIMRRVFTSLRTIDDNFAPLVFTHPRLLARVLALRPHGARTDYPDLVSMLLCHQSAGVLQRALCFPGVVRALVAQTNATDPRSNVFYQAICPKSARVYREVFKFPAPSSREARLRLVHVLLSNPTLVRGVLFAYPDHARYLTAHYPCLVDLATDSWRSAALQANARSVALNMLRRPSRRVKRRRDAEVATAEAATAAAAATE